MTPQPDCASTWRVVDADTGALVAVVASRAEVAQIVRDAADPSKYLVEAVTADEERSA